MAHIEAIKLERSNVTLKEDFKADNYCFSKLFTCY